MNYRFEIDKLFNNKYKGIRIKNVDDNIKKQWKNDVKNITNSLSVKTSLKYIPNTDKEQKVVTGYYAILYIKQKDIILKDTEQYKKYYKNNFRLFDSNNKEFIIDDWNLEPTELQLCKIVRIIKEKKNEQNCIKRLSENSN